MPDLPAPRDPRSRLLALPPPHVVVALALGGILAAIALGKGVTDPDYFWHVTTGKLIVTSGQVPGIDPFSFTWNGQPWTPHEWLAESLIYLLVRGFGETGALAVFALLPAGTLALLSLTLHRLRVRTLAQLPVLALSALTMTAFATLRPQALSWMLLALLSWLLVTVDADHRRRVLLIGPLLLAWANLHGLYIVGIGVVTAYALFTLIGRTTLAPHRGWAVAAVVLAVGGAMVTPAGPLGVLYPLRYGQAWGLANIQEWQSPNFHDPAHWPLLALVLWLILNGGRSAPGWLQAIAYVGTLMALVALRNTPVAGVLAAPALALGLEDRLRARWGDPRPAPARLAVPRRVMELALAAIVVGAAVVIFGMRPAADRAAAYPVAAVDLLETSHPEARVVAEYGWGGYVIHELYERGGRVFVDGRNDMYTEEILDAYTDIGLGNPGWEDQVDRYGADTLLFPPSRPITKGIAQAAGWCERYRDATQVLLARTCP